VRSVSCVLLNIAREAAFNHEIPVPHDTGRSAGGCVRENAANNSQN
jgi:hypothetical protein